MKKLLLFASIVLFISCNNHSDKISVVDGFVIKNGENLGLLMTELEGGGCVATYNNERYNGVGISLVKKIGKYYISEYIHFENGFKLEASIFYPYSKNLKSFTKSGGGCHFWYKAEYDKDGNLTKLYDDDLITTYYLNGNKKTETESDWDCTYYKKEWYENGKPKIVKKYLDCEDPDKYSEECWDETGKMISCGLIHIQ